VGIEDEPSNFLETGGVLVGFFLAGFDESDAGTLMEPDVYHRKDKNKNAVLKQSNTSTARRIEPFRTIAIGNSPSDINFYSHPDAKHILNDPRTILLFSAGIAKFITYIFLIGI
jgi:hypothetical protein